MRRTLHRAIVSTSVVAGGLILGPCVPSALGQSPAGSNYYYPAPGAVSSSGGYSYEPAPRSSSPAPGNSYYYPAQANAGRPGGYYDYPGPGYVAPPQGRYYYYPAPSAAPSYAVPGPSYTAPEPATRRGMFGFPRQVNPSPRPGGDDDYAYKS